jgi:hypothetical protein
MASGREVRRSGRDPAGHPECNVSSGGRATSARDASKTGPDRGGPGLERSHLANATEDRYLLAHWGLALARAERAGLTRSAYWKFAPRRRVAARQAARCRMRPAVADRGDCCVPVRGERVEARELTCGG